MSKKLVLGCLILLALSGPTLAADADGRTIKTPNVLVDKDGNKWSFGVATAGKNSQPILKNGVQWKTGAGIKMTIKAGEVWAQEYTGRWFKMVSNGYQLQPAGPFKYAKLTDEQAMKMYAAVQANPPKFGIQFYIEEDAFDLYNSLVIGLGLTDGRACQYSSAPIPPIMNPVSGITVSDQGMADILKAAGIPVPVTVIPQPTNTNEIMFIIR